MARLADGREDQLAGLESEGDGTMSEGRYSNVSEMVDAISDDDSFKEQFKERLHSRQIIRSLVAERASQGVSQSDIADELGCTQSRISKVENGFDLDLSLRDLAGYAKVLGKELHFLSSERGYGLADRVKYHAFSMREALLQLVELAHKDDVTVRGVAKLHAECFVNVVKFLQETSSYLPPSPDDGEPYIRIVNCEDIDDDPSDDAEVTAEVPDLAVV